MPTTKEEVNQLIASHSIVIFSKTSCPFCKMAKQVFHNLQKEYTAIELNERNDGDEIQSILGEMTGARTVPRVFVNGVGRWFKNIYVDIKILIHKIIILNFLIYFFKISNFLYFIQFIYKIILIIISNDIVYSCFTDRKILDYGGS